VCVLLTCVVRTTPVGATVGIGQHAAEKIGTDDRPVRIAGGGLAAGQRHDALERIRVGGGNVNFCGELCCKCVARSTNSCTSPFQTEVMPPLDSTVQCASVAGCVAVKVAISESSLRELSV
jgi:hypothetical protein